MKIKLCSYNLTPNQRNIGVLQLIKRFNSKIYLWLSSEILGLKAHEFLQREQIANKYLLRVLQKMTQ